MAKIYGVTTQTNNSGDKRIGIIKENSDGSMVYSTDGITFKTIDTGGSSGGAKGFDYVIAPADSGVTNADLVLTGIDDQVAINKFLTDVVIPTNKSKVIKFLSGTVNLTNSINCQASSDVNITFKCDGYTTLSLISHQSNTSTFYVNCNTLILDGFTFNFDSDFEFDMDMILLVANFSNPSTSKLFILNSYLNLRNDSGEHGANSFISSDSIEINILDSKINFRNTYPLFGINYSGNYKNLCCINVEFVLASSGDILLSHIESVVKDKTRFINCRVSGSSLPRITSCFEISEGDVECLNYILDNVYYNNRSYPMSYGEIYNFKENFWHKIALDYTVYGVQIDLSNSDPKTSVSYTDDAIGLVAANSAYTANNFLKLPIFKDIKPCVLKNGKVINYLKPNNFEQYIDGNYISYDTDENIMIEFPRIGYKITKSGTTLTVQITDDPNRKGFSYAAFERSDGVRDHLYIGAYLGSQASTKLQSVPGVAPKTKQTISAFRTAAQANGTGYDQLGFYQLTLLQCLYLIMYKNLDSQSALGKGVTGYSAILASGGTKTKGMCWGDQTGRNPVKFLGIENFWGNVDQCIDGMKIDSNGYLLTAVKNSNFNDTGEGYIKSDHIVAVQNEGGEETVGYVSNVDGSNVTGFLPTGFNGSTTTYFSDYAVCYPNGSPSFGGYYADGGDAGIFKLFVNGAAIVASNGIGGRLMYL